MLELFLGLIVLCVCALLGIVSAKIDDTFGEKTTLIIFVVLGIAYFMGKLITIFTSI